MIVNRFYAALALLTLLLGSFAARADEYEFDDDDAAGPPVAENSTDAPNVFDLSRAAFAQQAVVPLFSRGEYDKAAEAETRASPSQNSRAARDLR